MKIGDVEIKNNIFCAPMAGISSAPYRLLAKEQGAGLVYAEMVSDKGLHYENIKTKRMLLVDANEHPLSMQIFGSDIETLVNAAKIVDQCSEADIIDINMGCPVKKVASKAEAGAALMRDPNQAERIMTAVVQAVKKPVTVKIRAGWNNESINAVDIARRAERAGISAIAVHPRTKTQLYSGKSDWRIIKAVKAAVSIPVIGNGDIHSGLDAKRMLDETGCDAIMIGRAALGNPWIFREIETYLASGEIITRPRYEMIEAMIYKHAKMLIEHKNEKVAMLEMRSHAAWYLKGLPHASTVKQKLSKIATFSDFEVLIGDYFAHMTQD